MLPSNSSKHGDRLLEEKKSNKAEIRTLDYLETKAESVFNAAAGLESLVPLPDSLRLVELETLFNQLLEHTVNRM
jgi:hypothetical protein